ncbi:MAG: MinD/ParA family protein [Pseudomonadales bacterium]|nr:MinD/ParA family protein [Pseudomonadales bacterium]
MTQLDSWKGNGHTTMQRNNPVRVIAVTGGKGGIGKTSISINLAIALAESGNSVLLMDADLGLANVDIMLNLKPSKDLHGVVSGEYGLQDVLMKGPKGIDIIPASSGIGRMADLTIAEQAELIHAFSDLETDIDTLVVDTAAGISSAVLSFAKASSEIFVVICDEPASIADAYALMKVMSQEHDVKSFKVIANRVKDAPTAQKLYSRLANVADLYLQISLGYLGHIPEDGQLLKAVRRQAAVMDQYPDSQSAHAFRKLANRVNRIPTEQANSGYLQFFVERFAQSSQSDIGDLH